MKDYQNDLDMFQAAFKIGSQRWGWLHVYLNFKRGEEFSCQHWSLNRLSYSYGSFYCSLWLTKALKRSTAGLLVNRGILAKAGKKFVVIFKVYKYREVI